jgi:hypothetical protein
MSRAIVSKKVVSKFLFVLLVSFEALALVYVLSTSHFSPAEVVYENY